MSYFLRIMKTAYERLRAARIAAGFRSALGAARQHEWTGSTYGSHENGTRAFDSDDAARYARAFKVSAAWLLTGEGQGLSKKNLVPVIGYVGAGAIMLAYDDHEKGAGIDYVDAPPGTGPGLACVRVRGDSMFPAYRDGDLLFFMRDGAPANEYVGRECVVRLDDGRSMVKTVTGSGAPGVFTLTSHNAPPFTSAIEWAAPVLWVKKGW